jgi:4-hydroxyphenylpyruvate dioxygenase-like putative hemolysin
VFGVYLEGGLADYKEWELKVKEMEAQVAEAKAKGAEKNVEIQEKIVEKTKVVREKGQTIIKYVDREVVKNEEVIKYIEQCPTVPSIIIEQMNKAATK